MKLMKWSLFEPKSHFFGNAADTSKFVAFGISGSERKLVKKVTNVSNWNFQLND